MMKEQIPRILAVVLLILVFVALSLVLGSDTNSPVGSTDKDVDFNRALELLKQQGEVPPPEAPRTGPGPVTGLPYTSTDEMREELGRALYDGYVGSLEHNRRVFEWQLRSSRIIFWVVLGLVAVGLIFSGIQFWKALRVRRPISKAERREMQTELEISTRGVRVSSTVLGVIILVISLAFLYLFLVHVYPIEHVRTPSVSAKVSEGTQ
jgi:cell division septal protein FtsQ